MPKYRTIPTYAQAAQFDGTNGKALGLRLLSSPAFPDVWVLDIPNARWASVLLGDWVVTFADGKRQTMVDKVFRERYEETNE